MKILCWEKLSCTTSRENKMRKHFNCQHKRKHEKQIFLLIFPPQLDFSDSHISVYFRSSCDKVVKFSEKSLKFLEIVSNFREKWGFSLYCSLCCLPRARTNHLQVCVKKCAKFDESSRRECLLSPWSLIITADERCGESNLTFLI